MPVIVNHNSIQKQKFSPAMQRIFLSLLFTTTITTIVALMSRSISQGTDDSSQKHIPILSPNEHNLPDSIAGYSILAVLNSDTLACIRPHVTRLVLQPPVDEDPSTYNMDAILQALESLGRDDITDWEFEFVGTSVTIDQIIANTLRWNNLFMNRDCVRFGGPVHPQSPN